MDVTDQLLLLTEVSIALAGFSGIVATFQFRGGEKKSRGDVIGLIAMVQLGLLCAFMAFLPLALMNFGRLEPYTWRISSGVAVVVFGSFLFWIYPHTKKVRFRGISRLIILGWWCLNLLTMLVMALNVLEWGLQGTAGPYVAGLLNPLSFVAYMFTRLLARPLWRAIREKEEPSQQ
jgi:hypothetical protein